MGKILDECLDGGKEIGIQQLGQRLKKRTIGSLIHREVADILKEEK